MEKQNLVKRQFFWPIRNGKVLNVDAADSYSKIDVFVNSANADNTDSYIKIMRNPLTKNQFVNMVAIDSINSYNDLLTPFILPYSNSLNIVLFYEGFGKLGDRSGSDPHPAY